MKKKPILPFCLFWLQVYSSSATSAAKGPELTITAILKDHANKRYKVSQQEKGQKLKEFFLPITFPRVRQMPSPENKAILRGWNLCKSLQGEKKNLTRSLKETVQQSGYERSVLAAPR